MKKLISLLIILFAGNIYAQKYEITCDYSYETYISEDEITKSFTIPGSMDLSGNIYFVTQIKHLPAYFFPTDRYGALWHNDAQIEFIATLTGRILTYHYIFKNYTYNNKELEAVFDQTRVLDMTQNFQEDDLEFDYDDGMIKDSYINRDIWINENHIKLEGCKLKAKTQIKL